MSAGKGSTVTIGVSGKAVQSEYCMGIPGTYCKKYGNEGLKATLKGVTYSKNDNFQFCHLFMLMQQGQKMGVYEKSIKMAKRNHATLFNWFGIKMNVQIAHALLEHNDEETT